MTLTLFTRSLHYKDSKNEPCVHSVSWISRWNLTKLAQILHWDGGKKWLDFSDLDFIFKVTLALCGGYLISIAYWHFFHYMGRVKRIWYLSPMRAAKVQASLRIRAVSPEPSLLAHTSSESRETFRQKARSLAPLNGWACAIKICHDGMLEDTNSLDAAHIIFF